MSANAEPCHSLKVRSIAAPWPLTMSWQAPHMPEDFALLRSSRSEYVDGCGRPLGDGSEMDPRSTPSLESVSGLSCAPSTLSTEWQK